MPYAKLFPCIPKKREKNWKSDHIKRIMEASSTVMKVWMEWEEKKKKVAKNHGNGGRLWRKTVRISTTMRFPTNRINKTKLCYVLSTLQIPYVGELSGADFLFVARLTLLPSMTSELVRFCTFVHLLRCNCGTMCLDTIQLKQIKNCNHSYQLKVFKFCVHVRCSALF